MALVKCTYQPTERIESKIDLKDLTNGSIRTNVDSEYEWQGTAILDKLLNVLGNNLKMQYDNGRIVGNDYSQAYARMMEISVTQAMTWIKLSKDIAAQNRQLDQIDNKNSLDACLQNNKLQLEEMKVNSDIKVASRQIAGYDDNLVIKLLQAELDAFALIYSSGMLDNPDLGPLNVTNLNMAWNMLVSRV